MLTVNVYTSKPDLSHMVVLVFVEQINYICELHTVNKTFLGVGPSVINWGDMKEKSMSPAWIGTG